MLGTLLMTGSTALAQPTWRRVYGAFDADEGAAVRMAQNGDFIVAGATSSFGAGSVDAYLLELNGDGNLLWSRTIGGAGIDRAEALVIDPDGALLIAGFSNTGGSGGYDGWLVKTDAAGGLIWEKYYGGAGWDFLYDVQPDPSGGYLLAGATYSSGSGGSDGWLLKTDAAGEVIWEATYGADQDDDLRSAKPTSDGGIVAAGKVGIADQGDAWVLRLTAGGDLDWEQGIGGDSLDFAMDVVETLDGGFSVVGTTHSTSIWSQNLHFKLSSTGDSLWSTIGGGGVADEEAMEHVQLPSGRFVTVGYTKTSGGGGKDLFALLTESDGGFVVQHSYGLLEDEVGYSVAQTVDGFVLCGSMVSTSSIGAGNKDVFVIRCDSVVDTETEVMSGTFDPTEVDEKNMAALARLYPNPACTSVHLSRALNFLSAHLIDPEGREVRRWTGRIPQELDLRGLNPGAYQLVTIGEGNTRSAQPLIIVAY